MNDEQTVEEYRMEVGSGEIIVQGYAKYVRLAIAPVAGPVTVVVLHDMAVARLREILDVLQPGM